MSRWRAISGWFVLAAVLWPLACQGGADRGPTSDDRLVQAMVRTAVATVREIAEHKARGAEVAQECRTARVLFVADLQSLHRTQVDETLAALDRVCPPERPPEVTGTSPR